MVFFFYDILNYVLRDGHLDTEGYRTSGKCIGRLLTGQRKRKKCRVMEKRTQ